jgi:hypothetical protein
MLIVALIDDSDIIEHISGHLKVWILTSDPARLNGLGPDARLCALPATWTRKIT